MTPPESQLGGTGPDPAGPDNEWLSPDLSGLGEARGAAGVGAKDTDMLRHYQPLGPAAEAKSSLPRQLWRIKSLRRLLDTLEALRWVQRNAAHFGGDASRVTVCGQSSGGSLVFALLASRARLRVHADGRHELVALHHPGLLRRHRLAAEVADGVGLAAPSSAPSWG